MSAAQRQEQSRFPGQEGYVLLAVTVLTFAMIIGSLAIFTTSSSETRLSHRRSDATKAFYLADGALERARARLADDRNWRAGWSGISLGDGTYSLAITDTAVSGHNNTVKLTGAGTVGHVTRRVEMVAELPPSGLGLALLSQSYGFFLGRVCITGKNHHNSWAYYGLHDRFLRCGEYTKGYTISPPPIYTDAGHFPASTYYDVRAYRVHGNTCEARIFDADGNDITSALGDSLTGRVQRWGGHRYFFTFNSAALVRRYFDQETGIFRRAAGDQSVVVDFGGPALERLPQGGWREDSRSASYLVLTGSPSEPVHTTLINTRFIGYGEADRLRSSRWRGGYFQLYHTRLEPYNGIAYIAHTTLIWRQSVIGSAQWPALGYSTSGSLTMLQIDSHGSLITLGRHISLFGPINLNYTEDLLRHLPAYLVNSWPDHVSGTLRVLSWRELPTTTTQGG